MTTEELIEAVRVYLDDVEDPQIWSDDELTLYLQDAEQEATERADLLETDGVDDYCKVPVVAGTSTYQLSSLVYDVKKARIAGQPRYLDRTSRDKLDYENPAWEDETGIPFEYYLTGNTLRLRPAPAEDGTLNLVVLRLPVTPIGTSPEINARHHSRMLDWVYRQAYLKDDADSYDPTKADKFEARFTRSFGERKDARLQTRQLKRTPIIMKDSSGGGFW